MPDSWGLPYARFEIGDNCSADHFVSHNIIFDTTFCGDWAGNTFQDSVCSSAGMSCESFVANNPSEFSEAYWLINYVDVYKTIDPTDTVH